MAGADYEVSVLRRASGAHRPLQRGGVFSTVTAAADPASFTPDGRYMFNQFHAPFSSAQCGVAHRPGGNRRRAPLQAYLLRALNGGRTCESAMPAFQGPAESGAGTIGCGRFDLVVGPREFDERPFSRTLRECGSYSGEHGWPVLPARVRPGRGVRNPGPRPPITVSARVVLERVALVPGSTGTLRHRRQACDRSIRSGSWERGLLGGVPTAALELLVELLDQTD